MPKWSWKKEQVIARHQAAGEEVVRHGCGRSQMDGEAEAPQCGHRGDQEAALVRLAVRNLAALENGNAVLSAFARVADAVTHRSHANTVQGSQRNIQAHYDLSNDFFRPFLDRSMMYSCAWYETAEDTLETAQQQKLDRICRKLELGPGDRVLEIGTGWGGFALYAARNCGCRITSTTISREQYALARERCADESRVEVVLEDDRDLRGRYDKLVSIEMFEAVGYRFYDTFFGACDRLLEPHGSVLLQTITINDQTFPAYRRRSDWIQKYIFPGAELASLAGVLASLGRATRLAMFHCEDMGTHYARTLAEWRRRFHANGQAVKALGFDDCSLRMWDYYLAYGEGAFLERHISDVQMLLTKVGNSRSLIGPWRAGELKGAIG